LGKVVGGIKKTHTGLENGKRDKAAPWIGKQSGMNGVKKTCASTALPKRRSRRSHGGEGK